MKKKYLKVLEDKFWFRGAFRKKIELGMSVDLPLALYRDLLLYIVYGFLKWEMIWGNGFMASPALFWWSHLYKLFSVPWKNYLSNRRLAKVISHWVCKMRKIIEFPTLFLVKSWLPPVDY